MSETKKMRPKKDCIVIRGANEHNLKGIDVDIPRNEFVVLTGLSGSGKSSLAFDTIYADNDTLLIPNLLIHAAIVFGCYLILPGKLFIEIRLIRISDSIQNLLYTHIRSN